MLVIRPYVKRNEGSAKLAWYCPSDGLMTLDEICEEIRNGREFELDMSKIEHSEKNHQFQEVRRRCKEIREVDILLKITEAMSKTDLKLINNTSWLNNIIRNGGLINYARKLEGNLNGK